MDRLTLGSEGEAGYSGNGRTLAGLREGRITLPRERESGESGAEGGW